MYYVADEEGAPAQQEHSHDDPHGDGGLVLLHQAVAHLCACCPHRSGSASLGTSSLNFPQEWGLLLIHLHPLLHHRLDPGQQAAPVKSQLNIASKLGRRLDKALLITAYYIGISVMQSSSTARSLGCRENISSIKFMLFGQNFLMASYFVTQVFCINFY